MADRDDLFFDPASLPPVTSGDLEWDCHGVDLYSCQVCGGVYRVTNDNGKKTTATLSCTCDRYYVRHTEGL